MIQVYNVVDSDLKWVHLFTISMFCSGKEHNFLKHSSNRTTTFGTMYDYTSVMHYGKDEFSNGNGSTIMTNLPEYQDAIGQRLEMSPNDVLKLRKLYSCSKKLLYKTVIHSHIYTMLFVMLIWHICVLQHLLSPFWSRAVLRMRRCVIWLFVRQETPAGRELKA